jgi:Haemolysin-type calcium binding protein related domain
MPTPPAPSQPDYLNLSEAVYTAGGVPTAPSGWSVLMNAGVPVMESFSATGMQAVAFQNNSTGVIVIAYEGTNSGASAAMYDAQKSTDLTIALGATVPTADIQALAFANAVAGLAGANPVYVTGHSLGGEEASFVQNQADTSGGTLVIAGGASFGALGVPLLTVADTNSNFTSYIDAGDIVPNFPKGVDIVGTFQPEGNSNDAIIEATANIVGLYAVAAGYEYVDHQLGHYASDLGVTLASADQFNNGSDLTAPFGTPITIGSETSSTLNYSVAAGGQTGEIFTSTGATVNLPTTMGSFAVIDAASSSVTTAENIVTGPGGEVTVTDAVGNTLGSYTSTQAAGGTVQINGSEIDIYNSSSQLLNSTQAQGNGDVVDVVYNQSGGALASTTYTYDPTGKLIETVYAAADANFIGLDANTSLDTGYNPSTSTVNTMLATPQNMTVADLAVDLSTNAAELTLANGLQYAASDSTDPVMVDPIETPEEVLIDYLSDLGISKTAAQLDTDNFNYLNPLGTPITVSSGTVTKTSDTSATDEFFVESAPNGSTITGATSVNITDFDINDNPFTVSVTPTNIMQVEGNITGDTITNMQELVVEYGVTLTADQYNSFTDFVAESPGLPFADIAVANGGTVALAAGESFNLNASGWDGTTLIGNDVDGQTLTASLFGNDTLEAGNGAGDLLVAGEGVDTLIGGTGGDNFYADGSQGSDSGLAVGSVIEGSGTGNTLYASGDISGATISGVQTLEGGVTLNLTEFDSFSAINGSITAATGGTYDFSGITTTGSGFIAFAGSDSGTIFEDSSANVDAFTASQSGNDTLIIGDGASSSLAAFESSGNDTLTAGNGAGDQLNASNSTGTDTLTVGNGNTDTVVAGTGIDTITTGTGTGDTIYADNGLAAGSSVTAGNTSSSTLVASGDISAATISGVATLQAVGSVTLTAAQFSGFTSITGTGLLDVVDAATYDLSGKSTSSVDLVALSNGGTTLIGDDADHQVLVSSASGNDTLTGGNGNSDYLDAEYSQGANTLSVGSGSSNTLDVSFSSGNNSVTATTGSSDYLDADSSTGSNALTVGNDASETMSDVSSSGSNTLVAGNGNGDFLNAESSTGANTLTAGNGTNDVIDAGTGIDTITTGTGTGDTVYADNGLAAGSSVTALNTTSSTLVASGDISGATITGVAELAINGTVTVDAAEFTELSSIEREGTSGELLFSQSGSYNFSSTFTLSNTTIAASSNGGTTLIGNSSADETLVASASGTDTLDAGSGNGDVLQAGGGTDVLHAGTGTDTLIAGTGAATLEGNQGYETYQFGAGFTEDTIRNVFSGTRTTADGEVDFTSASVTDENLWFVHSGNNLVVDLLGTNDQVTIMNWFGSNAGAQVESFHADGLTLDTQVAALVSAMASYASANPGFNPTTATSMPTNTALQTEIAAAWHS